MCKKISTRFAPLLLLILFFSCSRNPKNLVSYAKNFSDVIQTQQNLIFTFNHDMVDEEDLGKWDSVEYVNFTPKVPGRFRWANKKELVFSPAIGFKPSTDYKAEVTPKVHKKAKNKALFVDKKQKTLQFHTEYLKPESVNAFWAKGKNNGAVIRVGITFNYEVEPTQLKELVKVYVSDKDVSFIVDNTTASKEIFLTVNAANFGKDQSSINVKFLKGIKLAQGDFVTNEEYTLAQVLPSRTELTITSVESGFKDNQGFVRVYTSQELVNENLEDAYSFEPEVLTKAEVTENGLYITGEFLINNGYILTLKKANLKGVLGGTLQKDSKHDTYFGEIPPSISFTNKKAIYLSKAGSRNIGLSIVNVPEVSIRIYKIYENNILAYMRSNRYYDYYYYEEDGYDGYGNYNYREDHGGIYSSLVSERTIKTTDLPKVNGVTALNLDMPQIDEFKGIYFVQVSSKTDYYLNASKLVSVSDIGMIMKQSGDDMFIYANSILTAKPLADVDLHIISTNNQDVLQVKTDGKGVAMITGLKDKLKHFSPAMITARMGEDFNYLLMSQTGVETSRFDVSGKHDHHTGLDAFIYCDRNLYRPGEKVNFNVIVRNNKWEVVGDVPLKVKILLPNGKEYSSMRKNTNSQGAVDGTFDISTAAVTGNYVIEVYNGNDVLLTSKNISIEEFMPDRLKATINISKSDYQLGEKIKATVEAVNYFGPPAADRNYEMEFNLNRKEFRPAKFADYSFHIESKQSFSAEVRQGTTNASGIGTEEFELSENYKDMGLLEGSLFVTVFDESGRPVSRAKRFDVFTQPVMYGIKMDDYYVKTNDPMQVKLAAVSKDGSAARGAKAVVEVVQYEWQSVLTRNYSNYYYSSKRVEKLVSTKTVTFSNGETVFTFIPPFSGEYEIRVKREGAERYASMEFYAYRWGSTLSTSFDVNTEGAVNIVFDKEKYEVGDKAKVLFKAPFTGKLLVTLERNGIIEHRVIETDKKSAEIEIPVKDEYLPNIYISATLIKSLENSNIPLMVAHGYGSLNVTKKNTILPVEVVAVEKSRSSTKQKITVKTKPEAGIQVTVAVVDEGILNIKGFETPDPHGHFYAKRALEVSSFDLYPYLFPEMSERSSSGGDGYDLAKRINPLSNNRVKLVSMWSGILTTNSQGIATYEIDLPKFSGDLRIMAVAYKDKAFGSASKNMKVADPLVLVTGLPRFITPGDEVEMPLNISNTTNKNANATASVTITGPLQVVSATSVPVTVNANKENRVIYKLKALPQMGNATVKIAVNGLGETFTDETEITIRPSTSLLKTASSGSMKAGESKEISADADFIPSSIKSKLVVSKNPMAEFIDKFDYLLGYPHGCVEQTISKAFPQLYFADFVKGVKAGRRPILYEGEENERNPAHNVREAIKKLQGMQLYNGAMSYWQGGYEESWWGSVYAAHFLIEARKAGFDVDNSVVDRLLSYINYKTGSKLMETYYFYENGQLRSKSYASRELVYSLYVMAVGGQPNRALMNYYKSNSALLTIDEKYLLAAAFYLTADRAAYNEILPKQYHEFESLKATGGSFYSTTRNLAISLHALVETDMNNPQVPEMSRNLSSQLRGGRYLNTQELVFSFLALGKMAREANKSNVTATVKVNGEVVGNFANTDLVIDNDKLKGQKVSISTGGTGILYYFYETEGLSSTGKYEQIDNFMRVRKDFFDRFGNPLRNNTFKQNDLIVVRISISSLQNMYIENVVVTDMLPAGFEIENPRLTEGREYEWTEPNRAYPQHFDIRDDRINYYLTVSSEERYLYYMVRAVTKGKFIMGPIGADAMYNGEYRSYHGAGTVVIQ